MTQKIPGLRNSSNFRGKRLMFMGMSFANWEDKVNFREEGFPSEFLEIFLILRILRKTERFHSREILHFHVYNRFSYHFFLKTLPC